MKDTIQTEAMKRKSRRIRMQRELPGGARQCEVPLKTHLGAVFLNGK